MQEHRPRELAAIDIGWSVELRIPLDSYSDGLIAKASFVMMLCAEKGDPDRNAMATRITERGIEEGELASWCSDLDGLTEGQVVGWIAQRGIVPSDIVSMTIDRVEFADQMIASAKIF